jgi:hypothetical protein
MAPRSQVDVPFAVPQPKLNPGASPAAGVARSRTTASGRLPPSAQTLTVHRAGLPRSLLFCSRATLRQRLAGAVPAVVVPAVVAAAVVATTVVPATLGVASVAACVAVGVPEPDGAAEGVVLADGSVLTVAEVLADGVVVAVGVAEAGGCSVRVGVADAEGWSVRVGPAVGVPEGPVLGLAEPDPVVVGVALVVGVGLDDAVGGWLGGAAGGCSGWQDRVLTCVVRLAADAVTPAPVTIVAEAAVSRTPPAMRAAVAGCPCAKRMKMPYPCCSMLLRNDLGQYVVATATNAVLPRIAVVTTVQRAGWHVSSQRVHWPARPQYYGEYGRRVRRPVLRVTTLGDIPHGVFRVKPGTNHPSLMFTTFS